MENHDDINGDHGTTKHVVQEIFDFNLFRGGLGEYEFLLLEYKYGDIDGDYGRTVEYMILI